jgi:hypothetical protein
VIYSDFSGTGTIFSRTQNIIYEPYRPWVTIDTFSFGEFAFERPYIEGRTGYFLTAEEEDELADKATEKERKDELKSKVWDYTEISFDNGKTFKKMGKALAADVDFRYRLETGDMAEGMHYILIRSTMKNKEVAMTRMLVQVDKTNPFVRLISPEPGGVYNQELAYSASATDDVELVSLTYHLRIGDKNAYEIPGFLQGLYFEGVIPPFLKGLINELPVLPFGGGATFFDIAFGLSFFDDNVKIQVQYGMMTQDIYEWMGGEGDVRYGGNVFGIKLLANIYTLPLGAVWGPDFDWLYASFGVGANFSYFNFDSGYHMRDGQRVYYTQSEAPTWMSAILLQVEFPKVTIPKRKYLRTFSLFTEGEIWFVPTDVNASDLGIRVWLPKVIMGVRMYIF